MPIENNYILVLNYKNIKTQEQVDNTRDAAYIALGALTGTDQSHERLKEGYYAQAEAFLFKIELNNVDITTFWENWNDLKKQKTQNYNIRLVASKVCSVNGTQFKGDGGDLKALLLNAGIYQSLQQLGEIYNPDASVIHFDLNAYEIAKNHRVDLGVVCDPKITLQALEIGRAHV